MRSLDGYRLHELNREITITDQCNYEDSRHVDRKSRWSGLAGRGRTKQGKLDRELTHDADNQRWNKLSAFVRNRPPTIWFFPNFLFDFPDKIYIEDYGDGLPRTASTGFCFSTFSMLCLATLMSRGTSSSAPDRRSPRIGSTSSKSFSRLAGM